MMDSRALVRRFVLLTTVRWLPVGFTIPVTVLYALDRGLTIGEFGAAVAVQGVVVLLLELPSGSLADSWGRRPVLIAAAIIQTVALLIITVAAVPIVFAVAWALMGVFRALDSGALEAWFADAAITLDPAASVHRGLGAAGTAIGLAIGGGAIVSSGLVVLAPMIGADPLLLPIVVAAVVAGCNVAVVVFLLPERRPAAVGSRFRTAIGEVPAGLLAGARLFARSRVLLALVAVELFWGFGMFAFETLTPVKLGDVMADADAAASLMGPVAAGGWLLFAVGSTLGERLGRRFDIATLALLSRIVQGAVVVVIGIAAGPVGVIVAYLGCYATHGASGPLHNTLLHRQVSGPNRATVLSMNSMVAQPAGSIGAIVLGATASGVSVGSAFVVAGIVIACAAPLYLPAVIRRRSD